MYGFDTIFRLFSRNGLAKDQDMRKRCARSDLSKIPLTPCSTDEPLHQTPRLKQKYKQQTTENDGRSGSLETRIFSSTDFTSSKCATKPLSSNLFRFWAAQQVTWRSAFYVPFHFPRNRPVSFQSTWTIVFRKFPREVEVGRLQRKQDWQSSSSFAAVQKTT